MTAEFQCVQCDKPFSYEKGRGHPRRYCSDSCRNLRYYGRSETVKPDPNRPCKGCGARLGVGRRERNPRVWCSEKCRIRFLRAGMPPEKRREQSRRNGAIRRAKILATGRRLPVGEGHRKRARRFGVRYEPIKPLTIYERDRWKCGLCGKRVDQQRVYPDPLSPSLDHVVPLSLGGHHEPANVQCAHLFCNVAKGARGHGEQLALIG